MADRCTYWKRWTCTLTFLCCCWLGTHRSRCLWVPAWTSVLASPLGLVRAYGWTRHYATSECQLGGAGWTAGLHTSGSPSGSSWSANPQTLGPEWGDLQRHFFFPSKRQNRFFHEHTSTSSPVTNLHSVSANETPKDIYLFMHNINIKSMGKK